MKFIPMWYDADSVVKTDPVIEAKDREEATKKAFSAYNGNPPAPLLYLEEVK